MRRKDREMPEQFGKELFDQITFAVLATTNEDGSPYCVPISVVREGEAFFFHSAKEGHKEENMRARSRACLCCARDFGVPPGKFTTEYESAVAFGTIAELTDREEKIHGLKKLSKRHTPGNMGNFDKEIESVLDKTAVWRFEIDHITAKGNRK